MPPRRYVHRFGFLARRRVLLGGLALALCAVILALIALGIGSAELSLGRILDIAIGRSSATPGERLILGFRLPRVLTGLSVGAALGVSGAVFQSLSRNPLGSPDLIGFTTGAATGALLHIVVYGPSTVGAAMGAVAGGALTAVAVWLLARRQGAMGTRRLVLVGVGVGAILHAVNGLLLVKGDLDHALLANLWLSGSLNARAWAHAWLAGVAIVLFLPPVWLSVRRLALLEMGDDVAAQLGLPVTRVRLAMLFCAVMLASLATGAAGPIAFIALAAPQLARRLLRSTGPSVGGGGRHGRLSGGGGRPARPADVLAVAPAHRQADRFAGRPVPDLAAAASGRPMISSRGRLPMQDCSASPPCAMALRARGLTLAHDLGAVCQQLDLDIPAGRITVILGPNGCGKSTLLRGLARLLAPQAGTVLLDGKDLRRFGARELAVRLGCLPQAPQAPDGIRVAELVARGRYPHQAFWQPWRAEDDEAVQRALEQTRLTALADRPVDTLSGGQRQRAWLAFALAQNAPVMLLDEPTTYLDIAHQLEVLDLCRSLNQRQGKTLVMVLHDLNQAARYADHIVALRDGKVQASGPPAEVITPERVRRLFGIRCVVMADPVSGTPLVVPVSSAETD